MSPSTFKWNYLEGDRAEVERLGDSVPLFRIKTRTPAISSQRKKPLWASFEERRQTEEKEEEEAARREVATEHHVTESEGYLALDLKHDFQNTQESEKFGDFSSIFKYLQSEKEKLSNAQTLDTVKVQVMEPVAQNSQSPIWPTTTFVSAVHEPSTLSHEVLHSPASEDVSLSSRATTPRGSTSKGTPSDQTEAPSSPGRRRDSKKSSSSSSFMRMRKSSKSLDQPRELATSSTGLSSAEDRALLASPESTRSITTNLGSLFDTDVSTDASVDTDLDMLSLAPSSARASTEPSFFRDPPSSIKQSSPYTSHEPPVTTVATKLSPKANPATAKPLPLQAASESSRATTKHPSAHRKRFEKTSDKIFSLLKKLQHDFPRDMDPRTIFPNARALPSQSHPEPAGCCWSFIDNSNIIVGFLDYLRSHPDMAATASNSRKPKIDYHSLFAILERRRNATRRVLVGSSPLQQSLDVAEEWFYEVHILSRVLKPAVKVQKRNDLASTPPRNPADLSTTDSGSGADDSDSGEPFKPKNHRNRRRPQDRNLRKTQQEQAVDEVLQVRMYEALFSARDPQESLKGTTLVLASGDGAASEFSPAGFLGPVRAALAAGCQVEIVSWADGMSSVWKQECQKLPGLCKIIYLDRYIEELLE